MAEGQQLSPDRNRAKELLDDLWAQVLNEEESAPVEITALVNSDQTAIRFCLPTQLLGKLTDNSLTRCAFSAATGAQVGGIREALPPGSWCRGTA